MRVILVTKIAIKDWMYVNGGRLFLSAKAGSNPVPLKKEKENSH